MIFKETKLKDAYIIEFSSIKDHRGFFAMGFSEEEFKKHNIDLHIVQINFSHNKKRGTLRGMHFQKPPHAQAKLLYCSKGSIYDVIIDLRPDSTSYMEWTTLELRAQDESSSENHRMLYVPEGFAHGFQTLEDDTAVVYYVSDFYHPECEDGVRWDDKAFNIPWPVADIIVSEKDKVYPDFKV